MLKDVFCCIFSALLLILSFPRFGLGFMAYFAFVPLLIALEGKTRYRAFLCAYLFGILFWSGILFWVVYISLTGMILLILILSLYFGIFGMVIAGCRSRAGRHDLIFIPVLWTVLEYARGHLFTGFPWVPLGYSQYLFLPLIQIADITGVGGISFVIMMINVAVKKTVLAAMGALRAPRRPAAFPSASIFAVCLVWFAVFGYGMYKLQARPGKGGLVSLNISTVQANISRGLKDNPAEHDYITRKYLAFTEQALRDKPDLIIWPEAAFGTVLKDEPRQHELTFDFVKYIRTPLLLGLLTLQGGKYYNSALFVSADGKLMDMYNKIHLVPFSEYVPLKQIFGLLPRLRWARRLTAGKEYTLFSERGGKRFCVLICFEDIFPDISRRFVKNGADFLVNIVDDGWFKRSDEPHQHLQAAVFRALENRVFLVRSANTGPSAFISPNGEILSVLRDENGEETFIEGSLTHQIDIPRKRLTFYTRYGDVFIFLCFIILIALAMPLKIIQHILTPL